MTDEQTTNAGAGPVERNVSRVVTGAAAHLEFAKWICEAKTPHKTKGKARIAAQARIAADRTLKALYGYRCAACRTWHLTKKKKGQPLAAQQDTANVKGNRT